MPARPFQSPANAGDPNVGSGIFRTVDVQWYECTKQTNLRRKTRSYAQGRIAFMTEKYNYVLKAHVMACLRIGNSYPQIIATLRGHGDPPLHLDDLRVP